MKAKLAGIASHTGMSGVFRLRGADVYRVLDVEALPVATLPAPVARRNLLGALRTIGQRMATCADLEGLLDETLSALESLFEIPQAMVLMADEPGKRLYTVASRGYDASGVGSEIPFGAGVIGVAARERTPIRITHMTAEYAYGRAIRESAAETGYGAMLETEIPLPGLPESRSQLAVPILAGTRLVGILYVESAEDQRFGYDDEDALVAVAGMLGLAIHTLGQTPESPDEAPAAAGRAMPVAGAPLAVRHYRADCSVFLGDDYLIKGVAGAIFWKLISDYVGEQRSEFTNRELRLDPALRLPDISDNLEARLILLQRRLAERTTFLRIEKTGRGRFRLCVGRPVQLQDVSASTGR
jgi:adenylate cyclase